MNTEMKESCFAYLCKAGEERCTALDRLYCKEHPEKSCRFYKTRDERELAAAMATVSRIMRKRGEK